MHSTQHHSSRIYEVNCTSFSEPQVYKSKKILPESVIATLITEFHGFVAMGNKIKNIQLIKKIIGIKVLTFIGRGRSGCLRRIQSMPKMLAATENQSIWL